MSQSSRPSRTSRRKFLRGAAVVTAATVTAPTVVSAQGPINMRWQSTWPSKDIFHEYALDYAKNRSARSSTRSNCGRMYGGDERQESSPSSRR
jgi:TRAP-type mannitol/chloroaromatic compound transport system substrate-binding protein